MANKLSKGENTKQRMINAAISCLATQGQVQLTFQQIADKCGVTQPLVVHYFKKKENILPLVMSEVVSKARLLTDEKLKVLDSPVDQLEQYIKVTVKVFGENRELSKVFMLRYYMSGIDPQTRKQVTAAKNRALSRLDSLIRKGIEKKIFRIKENDIRITARMIHDYLTGVLISQVIINSDFNDKIVYKKLFEDCLTILKTDSSKLKPT